MSEDDFFAPPPFKPAEALVQVRRTLRDWRLLTERGDGFEFKGQPVLKLSIDGAALRVEQAARPARSPDWKTHRLASSLDVRKFTDTFRKQVQTWGDSDD